MSWNLTKKLDTFAGPSEMKRREVSWNLTKKFSRHLCGSRRDQEEGGELESHEEVQQTPLRVQAR